MALLSSYELRIQPIGRRLARFALWGEFLGFACGGASLLILYAIYAPATPNGTPSSFFASFWTSPFNLLASIKFVAFIWLLELTRRLGKRLESAAPLSTDTINSLRRLILWSGLCALLLAINVELPVGEVISHSPRDLWLDHLSFDINFTTLYFGAGFLLLMTLLERLLHTAADLKAETDAFI